LTFPTLAIVDADGVSFQIEWPANLPGWEVEESPDLTPASWVASPLEIQTGGGRHYVIVTPQPGGQRFYRLAYP
jgi:hypothetical protein